ncbi:uncharacterized protein LOC111491705 isoform X1 [Cucurbita maxima]|uniref:Uncharacterized protein LOC111491705 isoform X1 n=1 Tax=Cucurbita maxima TaxID=3661 RepID=A0A6J1K200_CUCMA|nr:uncharacterized protein LOC111491705 isoform X1 [Cucurbita maxima]
MADKPSRALVIFGDGLARFVDQSHTHLHALASLASCGFLSLPNAPPSESEEKRMIRELALLFDACDSFVNKNGDGCEGSSQKKSIPERFMGMKAAILTNSSSVQYLGSELGVSLLRLEELMQMNHLGFPPVDFVASELLKMLGLQDGKIQDTSEFDLLFIHMGVGDKVNGEKDKTASDEMKYIDALVGDILQKAQPGSEIGSRLHLSLVMSYGNAFKDDECNLSVLTSKDVKSSDLSALFPHQSYTMMGEVPRNDVRHHSPMLAAQWQYGVTRKDKAETFSFKEFKEQGSNLVIPADRFIHEVAFKLWKAPKYGA